MNLYKKIMQKNSKSIILQHDNDDHIPYQYRAQQQQKQSNSYCYMSFIATCSWILVFICAHMITQQQRHIFLNDNNNDRHHDILQTMSLLSKNDCENSNHTITTTTTTTNYTKPGTTSITNTETTTTTMSSHESKLLQCNKQYQSMKQYQTPNGLSNIDYKRSRAYYGNPLKLFNFIQRLQTGHHPSNIIVCGGSITLGHGIEPKHARYGDILQTWLNQMFPMKQQHDEQNQNQQQHNVHIKGGHGADMCAMSKRLKLMNIPDNPDLFILEFAVNDYQGQDHEIYVDSKTDVFYDGYERLALCCEIVISYLIRTYPTTPIVFLEFQTTILNRKNAQLLHTGVAQHYQIPIISYGDVMLTHYYQLINQLNESSYYTTTANNTILSYPHGCKLHCDITQMHSIFHSKGCMSVCHFMEQSGMSCPIKKHYGDRKPCYLHYLAHDAVHPSVTGHQLALDMIIELFATTIRDVCLDNMNNNNDRDDQTKEASIYNQQKSLSYEHIIPPEQYGWLANSNILKRHSDFVSVRDTLYTFAQQHKLLSYNNSKRFRLYGDGGADRKGWVSNNPEGNEYIEFMIKLPINICYVIYVSILKSYNNMGIMTIELINLNQNHNNNTHSIIVDGLWKPHISVPNDIQLNNDDDIYACTGHCLVRITTHPVRTHTNSTNGNIGNKVKITSLSARHCVP